LIKKEKEIEKAIEKIENEFNNHKKPVKVHSKKDNTMENEKKTEMDFDNCNIYLKNVDKGNDNRPESRKRSAYKFIEDSMREGNLNLNTVNPNTNSNQSNNINVLTNSIKSTKDPLAENIGNINNYNKNNYSLKNNIATEKKPEYESRRKKVINILNEIDNKVIDINLNNSNNNRNEIEPGFRKNNNFNIHGNPRNNFNLLDKDLSYADNFKKNLSAPNTNPVSNVSSVGLFESRRHINFNNNIQANKQILNTKDKEQQTQGKKNILFI
jgi:hypothetical protein